MAKGRRFVYPVVEPENYTTKAGHQAMVATLFRLVVSAKKLGTLFAGGVEVRDG